MTDRRLLKANARARLAQTGWEYVKVMLLYVLAAEVIPTVLTTAAGSSSELTSQLFQLLQSGIEPDLALRLLQVSSGRLLLQSVLSVVLIIYQTVLRFGLVAYTLRLSRGQESGHPELFSGFSMAGPVVGQRLVLIGLYILWAIALTFPLTAVIMFGMMSGSEAIADLFFVAGTLSYVVALLAIMLRYDLSTLALADQPELGAMGSIRYAKALILGHLGQYFVLALSFLGWILLCFLPAFVFSYVLADAAVSPWLINMGSIVLSLPAYLWLSPYINTATAGFYDALQTERDRNSSPMGPL